MKFRGWIKHWNIAFLFLPKWVDGMTIFPFIFVRPKSAQDLSEGEYETLIRHEQIHIIQQGECLVLPWFIIYGFNYLINLIRFKKSFDAYYNICYEREAYQNEAQKDYLDKRTKFLWKKYFK